jgi:hypothetical protein
MADSAPLLFKKKLGNLSPSNRAAEEAMRALEDRSEVRVRITRSKGNTRRNGLYWSVLGIAAPMLAEKAPGLSVDLLHRVLKDRRGLFRLVTLPSGEAVKDYDSISFAKMTEPDRAQFIDWSLETLSSWLGCDVSQLRQEGEAEMGVAA